MEACRTFIDDEDGAVTVDWVVLTAALVGLGIAVLSVLWTPFETQATKIGGYLAREDLMCADFCDRTGADVGAETVPTGG